MTKGDSEKPTAVATWNPATLELTMATTLGGNTPGAVYKVDPNTGKVTDKDGKSKGSMNADGTIESPNLGTINVIPVNDGKAGFDVKMGDKHIGKVSLDREVRCHYNSFNGWGDWGWRNEGLCTDKTVNPLLVAYVYFGLIFTKGDINVNFYGYDPDKKYTVEELEDKIEWKNASAENEVMEYESSRPYAGFDREKFPHLKNCKVAAVGLMSDWKESKTTHTSGTDYAGTTWHKTIQYWVVYELTDGRNIHSHDYAQIRNEMRNGSFTQWLSVFYHEDPFADFTEEYAYEHTLEEWLNAIGKIDSHQSFYKRFVDAREETSNRIHNVRSGWERAKGKEKVWRMAFYALSALWILMMLFIGVKDRTFLLGHSFISIGLPLGGMTGIIVATRAYFRGYDFFFSFLWGLGGAFSSFIPIIILKYMDQSHPSLFNLTVIAITLVYMLISHLTDFRGDQKADNKLITEVLDNDIKSTLLEPLYYTFKTKSYKFKGSKFGLLDDVADQVRSISGESVLHYVLWSILALIFVLDFIIYSPSLLNVSNPDIDNFSFRPSEMMQKIEKDVE